MLSGTIAFPFNAFIRYRNVSLNEFRHAVHNVVSQEPFAARFAKLFTSGNRRRMIEMLMEMPYVASLKPSDSYQGKDDVQAARLYEKSHQEIMDNGNGKHATEKTGTCNDTLTKALFAASANGKVFLDALYERVRRSYSLRAYASCRRDCECMLALPTNFYDDSAENVKYFVQRRKECLQLERECSRKVEVASVRKRSSGRGKMSTSSITSSPKTSRSVTMIPVDGRQHSRLVSCTDGVTLQFDVVRGRHLVATRDIKPGAVLIVDQPFSYGTDAPALARNCLHCHATLKLEDSIKIPCRNCQTVSRSVHDYIHACTCHIF